MAEWSEELSTPSRSYRSKSVIEEDEDAKALHCSEAESERDFLQKFGDAVMNAFDLRGVSGMIDELDGVKVDGETIMECMVSC